MANDHPAALRAVLMRGDVALVGALVGAVAGGLVAPRWLAGRPWLAGAATVGAIAAAAVASAAVMRNRPTKFVYGAVFGGAVGRTAVALLVVALLAAAVVRSRVVGPDENELLRRQFEQNRVAAEKALGEADKALDALRQKLDGCRATPERADAFNAAREYVPTYNGLVTQSRESGRQLAAAVAAFAADRAPSAAGRPFTEVAGIPEAAGRIVAAANAEIAVLQDKLDHPKPQTKAFDTRKLDASIAELKQAQDTINTALVPAAAAKALLPLVGDMNTYGSQLAKNVQDVQAAVSEAKVAFDASNSTDNSKLEDARKKWEDALQKLSGEASGKLDAWRKQIDAAPPPAQPVGIDTNAFHRQLARGNSVIERGIGLAERAGKLPPPPTLHDEIKGKVEKWQADLKAALGEFNASLKAYAESNQTNQSIATEISTTKPNALKRQIDDWEAEAQRWATLLPPPAGPTVVETSGSKLPLPLRLIGALFGWSEHKKSVRVIAEQLTEGVVPEEAAFDKAFAGAGSVDEQLQEIEAFRQVGKDAYEAGKMPKDKYDKFQSRMNDREQNALAGWTQVVRNIYLQIKAHPADTTVDALKNLLEVSVEQQGGRVKAYKSDVEKAQAEKAIQSLGADAMQRYWYNQMSEVPVAK